MIKRAFITVILTIALTLISFGHRTLSPDAQAQADAYILAGGSWADLCGSGTDPTASAAPCIACVISQSCALPPRADIAKPSQTSIRLQWMAQPNTHIAAAAIKTHHARAPPFV